MSRPCYDYARSELHLSRHRTRVYRHKPTMDTRFYGWIDRTRGHRFWI